MLAVFAHIARTREQAKQLKFIGDSRVSFEQTFYLPFVAINKRFDSEWQTMQHPHLALVADRV